MHSLLNIPNWILWKRIQRRGKWTKQPINLQGAPASINTDRFTSKAVIEAYLNGIGEGVGFVFTEDAGIVGIDIDNCVDIGVPNELAREVIKSMNSYTELSPSGNGIHILVRASFPHGKRLQGIEIYGKGRFFTVTWNQLPGTPTDIMPRQEELTALLAKFRQPTHKRTPASTATQITLTIPRIVVG